MRGGRHSEKGTSGVRVKRREHQLISLIPIQVAKMLELLDQDATLGGGVDWFGFEFPLKRDEYLGS